MKHLLNLYACVSFCVCVCVIILLILKIAPYAFQSVLEDLQRSLAKKFYLI